MLGYRKSQDREKNGQPEEDEVGQGKIAQFRIRAPSLPFQEASANPLRKNTDEGGRFKRRTSGPVITFTDRDIRRGRTGCDEPMVISVVAKEYKIEKNLTKGEGALYGFAGERVPIKGTVELETTFGDRNGTRTILVLYTVVDTEASYNIIIGRLALNKLEAIVSTHHLCMKFLAGRTVAIVWADATVAKRCYEDSLRVESTTKGPRVNVLDFDLDLRYFSTEERPHLVGDLKEVQIRPSDTQKMKIDKALDQEEEDRLV
ncbi:hypothetical protein CR513_31540, partial [Mucuna pruriens]